MISLKQAAAIKGLQTEIILGLIIVSQIFAENGQRMTITEVTGGTHSTNSLHYKGLAADIRSKSIGDLAIKEKILKESRIALTPLFDMILESPGTENEHYHLEYDPK